MERYKNNLVLWCCFRQSLGNGTLYFPPFRAEDYRADVHSTIYRCRASNIAGTILSREVHVQAGKNYCFVTFHCGYYLDTATNRARRDVFLNCVLYYYIID